MIPQRVTVERVINGPDGIELSVTVTVTFDPPLPMIPEKYDSIVKLEAENAAIVAVERARK